MGFIAFFFDMLTNLFTHGWPGIIVGTVIVLVVVLILGLIGWGVFHALDSWFRPEQQGSGKIIGRSYSPARWQPVVTTTSNGNGGTNTTVTQTYIPASWSVTIQMGDRTASMECEQSLYDSARQDEPVTVYYVDGRLSKKFYIRALL